VLRQGKKRVGVVGFSFKAGTDDLRESPIVTLTEALLGKGLELKIYDANVNLARLTGANRRFIEREIPHIASLLCDTLDQALAWGEVVVVGNQAEEFSQLNGRLHNEQFVVDLVRAVDPSAVGPGHYWGICW
jgi:GDP-mannose 6-dehydrogenase